LVAPEAMKRCGTFFWFMYFMIAALVGAPSGENSTSISVAFDQLARLLDGLGRL